jgi:ABC-type dipeptide/oligopeptide/nickel transport system permease subunit
MPHSEMVHWWFGAGFLLLALVLLAEAVVGPEVWNRRPWRRYLWPGLVFTLGLLLWPVMALYTNSTIHMIAHGSWAQSLMLAGAAELGLVRGKLHSQYWKLCMVFAMLVSGAAILLHEQQSWYFSRAAFLHHSIGWTVIAGSVFALGRALRPWSVTAAAGFAITVGITAVMLFSDRDTAEIFGHLSRYAGVPHR